VQFRTDILRGIRLAAIAFAVVLIGVAAYRMLHSTAEAQTGPEIPTPAIESKAAEPAPAPVQAPPVPDTSTFVPPPPPLAGRTGSPSRKASVSTPHPATRQAAAKQPGSTTHPSRATTSAEERPETPLGESAAVETPALPSPAGSRVGYKSLLESQPKNEGRPPAEEPADVAPPTTEKRGKRVVKALGRFFRGGKKEPATASKPPLEP
jgi:hypothetical protein